MAGVTGGLFLLKKSEKLWKFILMYQFKNTEKNCYKKIFDFHVFTGSCQNKFKNYVIPPMLLQRPIIMHCDVCDWNDVTKMSSHPKSWWLAWSCHDLFKITVVFHGPPTRSLQKKNFGWKMLNWINMVKIKSLIEPKILKFKILS